MKMSESHNLKALNPALAGEWHPTRNGKLTPRDFTPNSGKKAWWMCKKRHEWEAQIRSRNNGYGCPYCSGKKASQTYNLEAVNPDLSKEWHHSKNGTLKPREVVPNSDRKVWWMCEKGHEWKAAIGKRNKGTGCPVCFVPKPNKGSFKKGIIPKSFKGLYKPRNTKNNTYVITTIEEKKIIRYKNGRIVETKKIIGYARYVYGLDKIPEGWVIWHLDGDPLNNDIENLECISKEESLRRMRERRKLLYFGKFR